MAMVPFVTVVVTVAVTWSAVPHPYGTLPWSPLQLAGRLAIGSKRGTNHDLCHIPNPDPNRVTEGLMVGSRRGGRSVHLRPVCGVEVGQG